MPAVYLARESNKITIEFTEDYNNKTIGE